MWTRARLGDVMDTDRLRGILDLVEASLDDPETTGNDLASRAYLSRFHCDRLVSAALGEPPGAFRRRLLLERAAHRLTSSTDSVIEVVFDSGYGAPEAFARAFARAFGASPSDFRRAGDRDHVLRPTTASTSAASSLPPGSLERQLRGRSSAQGSGVRPGRFSGGADGNFDGDGM